MHFNNLRMDVSKISHIFTELAFINDFLCGVFTLESNALKDFHLDNGGKKLVVDSHELGLGTQRTLSKKDFGCDNLSAAAWENMSFQFV